METEHRAEFADIQTAYQRIRHQVVETPLLESKTLSAMSGGHVYLKCENLQHTGSFKFRGASNAILGLETDQRKLGVVSYSSGNHAQGVACAAKLAGIRSTIVMPEDAPAVKIANTRSHGANVVLYHRYRESREQIGADLSASTGAHLIRPYDDYAVIQGQGTAGLECANQLKARALQPDAMIICCGGGGLSAGCGVAMRAIFPDIDLFLAEPAAFDDYGRSLSTGQRQTNDPESRSICDAIVTPTPGELTFPIVKKHFKAGLSANDGMVKDAVKLLYTNHRIVAEPGGAIAVACFMKNLDAFRGKVVVLMISGGNIDPSLLQNIIST